MVFIKYHKEKAEIKDGEITAKSRRKLESRLENLGWTDLKWCPGNSLRDNDIREELIGCPPNYKGPYSDYDEEAVIVLCDPKEPGKSIGIKVRNVLRRPIFDGKAGWY